MGSVPTLLETRGMFDWALGSPTELADVHRWEPLPVPLPSSPGALSLLSSVSFVTSLPLAL